MKEVCECCGEKCEGPIFYHEGEDIYCCEGCFEVLNAQDRMNADLE